VCIRYLREKLRVVMEEVMEELGPVAAGTREDSVPRPGPMTEAAGEKGEGVDADDVSGGSREGDEEEGGDEGSEGEGDCKPGGCGSDAAKACTDAGRIARLRSLRDVLKHRDKSSVTL
jgi:hypothetical protein